MRARLTVGFVLILIPFLFATTHLLMMSTMHSHTIRVQADVDVTGSRALAVLDDKDWMQKLDQIFHDPEVEGTGLGAIVVDRGDNILWRSESNAPRQVDPAAGQSLFTSGDRRIALKRPDPQRFQGSTSMLYSLNVITTIAFGLGAWILVAQTLTPIRALARQAREAGKVDLRVKLESPSRDPEMRELVSTLNDLIGRIADSADQKARFYAAASHELRTPLQALSGHLELAADHPRSVDEYRAAVGEALTQTRRLTSLVEGILLIHQLDGKSAVMQESACLSKTVDQVLQPLLPLIEARHLNLTSTVEPVEVSAIPAHLGVLVRNLIDNAARHGREGGILAVESSKGELRVTNDLTADHHLNVARLGEAFFREDASRSSNTGGNGLGLAICQAVATANGWCLGFEQHDDHFSARVVFGGL